MSDQTRQQQAKPKNHQAIQTRLEQVFQPEDQTFSDLTAPQAELQALQNSAGNQAANALLHANGNNLPPIQAKLIVGAPSDRFEQEADRVANSIVQTSSTNNHNQSGIQHHVENPEKTNFKQLNPPHQSAPGQSQILRQQLTDEEERFDEEELLESEQAGGGDSGEAAIADEEILRAKGAPEPTPQVSPWLESQVETMRGRGRPLPETQRTFFESHLGHDLGQVRLHTDSKAAAAAQAVQAKALPLARMLYLVRASMPQGKLKGSACWRTN